MSLAIDPDTVAVELVAEEFGHPRRRLRGAEGKDSAAVVVEGESDVGASHRQPLHRIEAGRIFAPRAAQELAPRRHFLEQLLDSHAGPGGKRRRPLADQRAMVDFDPPPLGFADPAFEGQPRHAGNRRQRLAAKAEAQHVLDRVAGQLRRRVPLEREVEVIAAHARAVVGNLDQPEAARREPHRDLVRARIQRVLDELLERTCRPLDHLAGSDSVNQFGGKPSY